MRMRAFMTLLSIAPNSAVLPETSSRRETAGLSRARHDAGSRLTQRHCYRRREWLHLQTPQDDRSQAPAGTWTEAWE